MKWRRFRLTYYSWTLAFLITVILASAAKALSQDKDVLNLFSYTGSVSVFAMGGAKSVTTEYV